MSGGSCTLSVASAQYPIDAFHDLDEFRAKIYPLWDEEAKKSDISKRLVAQLKKYLSDKGVKLQ